MPMGRDGKAYARNIATDVGTFASKGIRMILCLLNDYEIRSIGCDVKKYEAACAKNGIKLFKYPIIEMAPPEDVNQFHNDVIEKVLQTMQQGVDVLVHCRGGIGRAGLVACCVSAYKLNKAGADRHFKSSKEVIAYVRAHRDKRCVESRKQEDFVKKYFDFIV